MNDMTLERTPEGHRGYTLSVTDRERHDLFARGKMYHEYQAEFERNEGEKLIDVLPCHDEAEDFDGKCYLLKDHDGDHAYQPVLDLFDDEEPLTCGIENPEQCETCT